jgi:hypothetical protein
MHEKDTHYQYTKIVFRVTDICIIDTAHKISRLSDKKSCGLLYPVTTEEWVNLNVEQTSPRHKLEKVDSPYSAIPKLILCNVKHAISRYQEAIRLTPDIDTHAVSDLLR